MPTLVSISVTPATATLLGGATQQLVATGLYSDNSTADLTGSATWSSSSLNITVVAGLVIGYQFGGVALITAAVGDITGTASIVAKKTQTKLKALMRILLGPFQDLENAIQQVLQISVTNATGATLTMLGIFVGQPRNGVSDDDTFRRYVRAKIAANRSASIGDDVLNVVALVLGDPNANIVANNNGDAAYELTIEGIVVTDDVSTVILNFLTIATQDGVRAILHTWPAPEADMFSFAPYGADPGTGLGWGSELDDTVGGVLASGRST